MSKNVRDSYIQYRQDPDNDDNLLSHFCSKYGFDLSAVRKQLVDDKDIENDILVARREMYAKRMKKIDDALFKSAEQGDTRAADLLYRRFDGWNPKIVEETNNFYNFADIAKKVARKYGPTRSVTMVRKESDGEA